MNLKKFKSATLFFIGILVTSIIFGCFIMNINFTTMDHGSKSVECCNTGVSSFINHFGPNIQYTIASNDMSLLVINFILALIIFLYIKSDVFINYYLIKDRYGGFKLFHKFTSLLKKGILHPKLY